MNARKSIVRASAAAARQAMAAHVEKMLAKGWKIDQQFVGGDSGIKFECITYFYK